jgi:hypothetical protein
MGCISSSKMEEISSEKYKQIKLLQKLISDPKMTLQKLIQKLTIILTKEFNLLVFGETIMTEYSGIPTNNLDIAYKNFNDWLNFKCIFDIVSTKININGGMKKPILRSYVIEDKIEYYRLVTCNETKLIIHLISWNDFKNQTPDFKEASLIIDKEGMHRRTGLKRQYPRNPLGGGINWTNWQIIDINYEEIKDPMIDEDCEKIKQITQNLKAKTLSLHPIHLEGKDTILFKINRLKNIVKKITQGYTIKGSTYQFNVQSSNALAEKIYTDVKIIIPPLIDIIVDYVIDNEEWYERNAKCCWCYLQFIDEQCFMPFCDCAEGSCYRSQCIMHYFDDGMFRQNKEKLMITNPNILWHYGCYKDAIVDFIHNEDQIISWNLED